MTNRYRFCGATLTEMEFTCDAIAIRCAQWITDIDSIKVARFNGRYWIQIN